MSSSTFDGRAVVAFEARRAVEIASLIARYGGRPIAGPAVREVPADQNGTALAFGEALGAGGFDAVVFLTGIGTRALVDDVAPVLDRAAFVAVLARVPLVIARGPKPAGVLRELGVGAFLTVPEPNTWREVVAVLTARGSLVGQRIAVQEHGVPSVEMYAALRSAGAEVTPVTVYRWALPDDTAPLRHALGAIASAEANIALFTSRAQVDHMIEVATSEGNVEGVRTQLARGVVASIGPVCSAALRAEGLPPDIEPVHSKMGHLVKTTAERCNDILAAKAGASR